MGMSQNQYIRIGLTHYLLKYATTAGRKNIQHIIGRCSMRHTETAIFNVEIECLGQPAQLIERLTVQEVSRGSRVGLYIVAVPLFVGKRLSIMVARDARYLFGLQKAHDGIAMRAFFYGITCTDNLVNVLVVQQSECKL